MTKRIPLAATWKPKIMAYKMSDGRNEEASAMKSSETLGKETENINVRHLIGNFDLFGKTRKMFQYILREILINIASCNLFPS